MYIKNTLLFYIDHVIKDCRCKNCSLYAPQGNGVLNIDGIANNY